MMIKNCELLNELFVDYIIFAKKERMESLKQRRTIRKYLPRRIFLLILLNDLLETSFRASTMGCDMQVYSVIVTRDAERKAKLAPAHFNQPMVKKAPVVLTFCIDLRRFSKWCEQRKAEPGYKTLMWFVTGAVDTLLVAQTFCVAAEEKGLGICYLGTTTYNPSDDCRSVEVTGIGVSHHDSHSGMACRTAGTSGPFAAGGHCTRRGLS